MGIYQDSENTSLLHANGAVAGTQDEEKGKVASLLNETDGVASSLDMEKLSLLKRIFPTGFKHEAKGVSKHIPGLIVTQICLWYVQPIVTIFGGHLGKIELDAIGLACSMINIFGFAIVWGTSAACDIAFSHTYGAQNKKMVGVYLQRCLIILLLTTLPCYALHINMEGLLLLFGQDPEVSRLCGRYMLIFIPGTLCLFLHVILQKYTICQNIINHDIWLGLVAHGIHAGLQYLLVYQLKMGIDGSAIAQVCFYVISVVMRLILMACSKSVQESWGGWSLQCFKGWGPLFRLALAGGVMMCAEWWAYEISTLLSGVLGIVQLGAQTVTFQIMVAVSAIAVAIAMAGMIRMGHHLGAGNPEGAITTGRVVLVITLMVALFWMILMLVFSTEFGKIFTSDPDILDLVKDIMPFVAIYTFFDCLTILGRHIFRVAAKQRIGAILVFATYYLFSIPIGYCLMFLTDLELRGLWLGFALSTIATAAAMTVGWNFLFKWSKISEEAKERAGIVKDETIVINDNEDTTAKEKLITDEKENYGSFNTHIEKVKAEATSKDKSSSMSSHKWNGVDFQDELEPVTRDEITKCCITIFCFFLVLIIGVIIRCSTQGIIDEHYFNYKSHNSTTNYNNTLVV